MSQNKFEPGFYVKAGRRKQANTKSQAVALVAEGYSPEVAVEAPAPAPAPTVSDTAPVQDDTPTPASVFGGHDESQEDE